MKESFTAEPACIHRLQPLWQTSNVPSKLCAHTGCKTSTHKKTWSAHVPLKNVFAHIRIFHTRHPEHCRRAFCASMYDEDLKFEWIVCVIYLISRINSIVFIEPQSLAMQAVAVCTMQLQLDIFKCKSWLKIWKNSMDYWKTMFPPSWARVHSNTHKKTFKNIFAHISYTLLQIQLNHGKMLHNRNVMHTHT